MLANKLLLRSESHFGLPGHHGHQRHLLQAQDPFVQPRFHLFGVRHGHALEHHQELYLFLLLYQPGDLELGVYSHMHGHRPAKHPNLQN